VRAAALGTYYENELICGLPISSWINLMEETHSFTGFGFQFNGWPDGKSLIDQEQCTVEILKIIRNEKLMAIRDGETK